MCSMFWALPICTTPPWVHPGVDVGRTSSLPPMSTPARRWRTPGHQRVLGLFPVGQKGKQIWKKCVCVYIYYIYVTFFCQIWHFFCQLPYVCGWHHVAMFFGPQQLGFPGAEDVLVNWGSYGFIVPFVGSKITTAQTTNQSNQYCTWSD